MNIIQSLKKRNLLDKSTESNLVLSPVMREYVSLNSLK